MTPRPARRNAVDLAVIGPPKSGTSSLFAALDGHPGIDSSHAKEPLFFTTDRGLDLGCADGPARSGGYDRGIDWYEDLFAGPTDALRMEGSSDYFPSPSSPALLAAHSPDVHVVVCLREPAGRLVSQYWHEQRFADLPPLQEMIVAGHPRLAYWRRCSEFGAGLDRWLEHVPSQRLHVVGFDEIRDDVTVPANRVLAAVGLAPLEAADALDGEQRNAAGSSRSRRLQRLLTVSKTRRIAEALPDPIQRPLRSLARRAMQANLQRSAYEQTPPEVLAELRALFALDRTILLSRLAQHWPDLLDEVEAWPT